VSETFDIKAYMRECEERNKLVFEMMEKLAARQAEDLRRRQVEALPFLLLPPRGQA
jgi:hypothetical protein